MFQVACLRHDNHVCPESHCRFLENFRLRSTFYLSQFIGPTDQRAVVDQVTLRESGSPAPQWDTNSQSSARSSDLRSIVTRGRHCGRLTVRISRVWEKMGFRGCGTISTPRSWRASSSESGTAADSAVDGLSNASEADSTINIEHQLSYQPDSTGSISALHTLSPSPPCLLIGTEILKGVGGYW